ncbi:MAG: hypothetical protein JWR10_2356 [Rubritepida sp.]|nr:hypothetical protein [Rubritepida sp.]
MAARKKAPARPVQAALQRLLDLATKAVPPSRMAREVDIIVREWSTAPEADPTEVKERLDELREQIAVGVADAEEQVSDVDRSEAAAVKQADVTLAALVATHDAAVRALAAL